MNDDMMMNSDLIELDELNRDEVMGRVREVITMGGLVIIPTDTVYGISADYFSAEARERVMDVKKRPEEKGFIVLVGSKDQVKDFAREELPDDALKLLPGALTLVMNNKYSYLYGEESIAVRMPGDPAVREMLERVGRPVVSTSANISGDEGLNDRESLVKVFGGKVELIVTEEKRKVGKPSTVLDIRKRPYEVLRQGEFEVPQELLAI